MRRNYHRLEKHYPPARAAGVRLPATETPFQQAALLIPAVQRPRRSLPSAQKSIKKAYPNGKTIHPKNKTVGMTRPEKGAVAFLFTLSAAFLCAAAIHNPHAVTSAASTQVCVLAIQFAIFFFLLPKSMKLSSFIKKDQEPDEERAEIRKVVLKLRNLQKEVDKLARTDPSLEDSPIVVASRESEYMDVYINPNTKSKIIRCHPLVLRRTPEAILRAAAAHEVAHVKIWEARKSTKNFLVSPFLVLLPPLMLSVGVSALTGFGPLTMFLTNWVVGSALTLSFPRILNRTSEFQADRLDCAMAGSTKEMAQFLEPIIQANSLTFPKSFAGKAGYTAATGLELALRFFIHQHPHPLRRVARLQTLDKPPSILRNLALDVKLLPQTLRPAKPYSLEDVLPKAQP